MENNSNNHDCLTKHIATNIPIIKRNSKIQDIYDLLEKKDNNFISSDYIYVIDKDEKLVGMIDIDDIFRKTKKSKIDSIIKENIITVSQKMELEKVADIALKHNLKQIPVTHLRKFLGVITTKQIFSTLNKSLKEDIFHFAGIHKSHMDFDNSLEAPFFRSISTRSPWLIIGLIGAIFMALFIDTFEGTLMTYPIIAAFIPALVYVSGALSAQTLTIFVRDIVVMGKDMNFKKYFLKQMGITNIISFVIVLIMFGVIILFWKQPHIAFVIALATLISLIATTIISIFIAVLIKKFKFDPALGSGPIATLISDMSSVLIYFLVVVWLL
jgi:magnesium transporter